VNVILIASASGDFDFAQLPRGFLQLAWARFIEGAC
jgi:hypothetical protein